MSNFRDALASGRFPLRTFDATLEGDPEDAIDIRRPMCRDSQDGWACTQLLGHRGPHRARGERGEEVYAEWGLPFDRDCDPGDETDETAGIDPDIVAEEAERSAELLRGPFRDS